MLYGILRLQLQRGGPYKLGRSSRVHVASCWKHVVSFLEALQTPLPAEVIKRPQPEAPPVTAGASIITNLLVPYP